MLSANQSSHIPVATMLMEREILEEIVRLVMMHRRDWPAVFSANMIQDLWPQSQFGRTAHRNRMQLRGAIAALDEIADQLLQVRPEGGRFFVNHEGAFMKDEQCSLVQFIRFRRRHH